MSQDIVLLSARWQGSGGRQSAVGRGCRSENIANKVVFPGARCMRRGGRGKTTCNVVRLAVPSPVAE